MIPARVAEVKIDITDYTDLVGVAVVMQLDSYRLEGRLPA